MQVENPIRLVRELKGAPISIILVLSFSTVRVTQEWIERATGYTDKPVSQALAYLREIGLIGLLSRGEEIGLARRAQQGDETAPDRRLPPLGIRPSGPPSAIPPRP